MNTQALKGLIKAKGLTQEEFASRIGMHDSKLSRIINGQDEGSFAVFAKIIEGLEFDPHQAWELLFERKYDKPVQEIVPDAVSLIRELQNDIEALKRDRDKVFKWAEGFGRS